jgi:hypothetical protein
MGARDAVNMIRDAMALFLCPFVRAKSSQFFLAASILSPTPRCPVSSWRCSFFPASTTEGNPRADLRFERRRHACVFPSSGASPRWFVESFVRVLESMVAAAQSAGFQGAMYTATGAPWSTISSRVRPRRSLANSYALMGGAVRWLVPFWSLNLTLEAPFFGCDTA